MHTRLLQVPLVKMRAYSQVLGNYISNCISGGQSALKPSISSTSHELGCFKIPLTRPRSPPPNKSHVFFCHPRGREICLEEQRNCGAGKVQFRLRSSSFSAAFTCHTQNKTLSHQREYECASNA